MVKRSFGQRVPCSLRSLKSVSQHRLHNKGRHFIQHSDEDSGCSKLTLEESGEPGGDGGFLLRESLSNSAAASERTAALSVHMTK